MHGRRLRASRAVAIVARMPPPGPPRVVNRLPHVLRQHGVSWGELGRRTLLPAGYLLRLRSPMANPRLPVAERVASALGVSVETIWQLTPRKQ